jgi:hypothetical protein
VSASATAAVADAVPAAEKPSFIADAAKLAGSSSSDHDPSSRIGVASATVLQLAPEHLPRKAGSAQVVVPATLEWEVWNKQYPAPIDMLSDVIFGPSNRFWLELFASRLYLDVSMSGWIDGVRTVKYTMPRKGLQGKTVVESTESITVKSDGVIVVDIETHTPGVPYGTSFCTCAQYQFKAAGPSSGTVLTTASVKWLKSCSLKGTITKKIKEGMTKGMKETLRAVEIKWFGLPTEA